jgi:hypothetical protein
MAAPRRAHPHINTRNAAPHALHAPRAVHHIATSKLASSEPACLVRAIARAQLYTASKFQLVLLSCIACSTPSGTHSGCPARHNFLASRKMTGPAAAGETIAATFLNNAVFSSLLWEIAGACSPLVSSCWSAWGSSASSASTHGVQLHGWHASVGLHAFAEWRASVQSTVVESR